MKTHKHQHSLLASTILVATASLAPVTSLAAPLFGAGDLVVSYTIYQGTASTIVVGQSLPNTNGAVAVANGAYPGVFANDGVDGNFGITSSILLQDVKAPNQITSTSTPTFNVTAATGVTTSFPSKSELAINLSSDGRTLSLGGYNAPINSLDRSNANTPGVIDPTNTDTAPATSRSVVTVNANGATTVTNTDNYSGNNLRAAVSANGVIYTAGNSGNGAKATDSVTTPGSVGAKLLASTGVQAVTPGTGASVSAGQYTGAADGYLLKDNNFRGLTVANNTLYTSKGSGSNGVNTVYQVGTTGTLPTGGAAITILPGLPTVQGTCTATSCSNYYAPFGLFFANSTTLYVADEGNAGVINDPNAGLEKYSLVNGVWMLDYTLQSGLNLYSSYAVAGYPTALDPYTIGLRNLTGRVNADGTVSLFAATSTNSALTDAGGDPNQIVAITDLLSATSLPANESFITEEGPQAGIVFRGVAFAPVPEPTTLALLAVGAIGTAAVRRRKSNRAD